ncbi:MAG: hypothetical protein ACREC9_15640 [Methylocella sp.]
MTPAGYSHLFAAALIGVASAAQAQGGVATRHNHDGTYAVNIVTRQGSCARTFHTRILVSGGRVTSAGATPMNVSGHINPHGNVHLTFNCFRQVATATGRLARGTGSGTWSSTTMRCAGSWRATRRS